MKLLFVAALFVGLFHGSTAYAQYCQCTSGALQEIGCIEVVSKNNPCSSNCDCEAGRTCLGGWCYGTASNTNCECLLGVQTYCQEAPYSTCNPNIKNSNCQCSLGRVCSSYGYCIGQSNVNYCTIIDIDDIIVED